MDTVPPETSESLELARLESEQLAALSQPTTSPQFLKINKHYHPQLQVYCATVPPNLSEHTTVGRGLACSSFSRPGRKKSPRGFDALGAESGLGGCQASGP